LFCFLFSLPLLVFSEANSKKIQAAEIAEAERLEKEALMRRGRSVGHGAHPALHPVTLCYKG